MKHCEWVYMEFTIFWVIDIGIWWITNMQTCWVNIIGIKTEARQRMIEVHYSRGIGLFI